MTASTSFALVAAAEFGDKSQLVCMMLASRYRPMPVIFGAVSAFLLLNTLAVIFGQTIRIWLPDYILSAVVALLFAGFGIHAIRQVETVESEEAVNKRYHSIVISTFLLITFAEFGDKTQLAVIAFSSSAPAIAVWLGSTLALIFTTLIGILVGKHLLEKVSLTVLHKLSGLIFLILAGVASFRVLAQFPI